MDNLSPAAQAVLIAQAKERCLFEWNALDDPPCHPSDLEWNGCFQCIDRRGIAAALRAVADQDETLFDVEDEMVPAVCAVRTDRLLAIAAELEGTDG